MGMERGNKVLGWDGREWEWSRVDAVVTRYKGFVRFIDSSATAKRDTIHLIFSLVAFL
jgi:hypothetical protein